MYLIFRFPKSLKQISLTILNRMLYMFKILCNQEIIFDCMNIFRKKKNIIISPKGREEKEEREGAFIYHTLLIMRFIVVRLIIIDKISRNVL